MKKILFWAAGLAALSMVVGFTVIVPTFNSMVPTRNHVALKVADLNTQYQRRSDLVPAIVNSVKGESGFEKGTLVEVTEARAKATSLQLTPEVLKDPEAMKAYKANQATLAGALGRLLVAAEKYPDLKSNAAFKDLRVTLEETENRIKYARQEFNKAVQSYNDQRDPAPANVITWLVGMRHLESFQADDGAQKMPEVNFN